MMLSNGHHTMLQHSTVSSKSIFKSPNKTAQLNSEHLNRLKLKDDSRTRIGHERINIISKKRRMNDE